jgi:hypothetical protein
MDYINKGARISCCKKYRYLLWREWRGTHDPKNWHWDEAEDGYGNRYGPARSFGSALSVKTEMLQLKLMEKNARTGATSGGR